MSKYYHKKEIFTIENTLFPCFLHITEDGVCAVVLGSNADHIGGCSYLQKQTSCRIYAPGIECDFTRHPVLEPAFLYGGFPSKDLRHKFLMAAESEAMYLTDDVLENGMKAIPLPGHFFDMTGFRTADDVVYLADCLSSRQTLEKYAVTFIYDVEAYLSTLDMVSRMEARLFVPSHADACEDISALARYNMDKVNEIAERICGFCREPKSCDEVIHRMRSLEGYSDHMDLR